MQKDSQFLERLQGWSQDYDKETAYLFIAPEFYEWSENYKLF